MVNQLTPISYKKTADLVSVINNINDSYTKVCKIWVKWMECNDVGFNVFGFTQYYNFLMSNHYSASTINVNIVMMKKRLSALLETQTDSATERSRLSLILSTYKAPTAAVRAVSKSKLFTKCEINTLISLAGIKTSLIVDFLYTTACRRGELCSILKKDCKTQGRGVTINIFGKRNKTRFVYIPLVLYNKINNVFMGKVYLFETERNQKQCGHNIWVMVSKAAKRHLCRRMSPHMLRHSRLTHLQKNSGNMKAVSVFAGHASVNTTLDLYVHDQFSKDDVLNKFF